MSIRCGICPHNCLLEENKFGICGTRKLKNNEIELPFYGLISAAAIDPVEKKPLYHFHPSKTVFSVGFFGCSLSCPFCQNHSISKDFKTRISSGSFYKPEELISKAADSGSFGIAYTYSEPLIHFEYLFDCMKLAKKRGLKNILVTNGYINETPGNKLLEYTDALNIDLKSFDEDFYKQELKGKLEPVLNFIQKAASRVHIEVTTLIIPGKNDSEEEILQCADFLSSINPGIPYHLSAYYPSYKYYINPTDPRDLMKLAEAASAKLDFVYTGNIYGGQQDTFCSSCGNLLIKRSGYKTLLQGISGDKCSACGIDLNTINIHI